MSTRTALDEQLAPERILPKPPPLYKVLLLNDDFTPMDFVVQVLEQIFGHSRELAMRTMLKVHHEGRGTCGIFSRDVAQTKVEEVVNLAQHHEHPLNCIMEEERK